MMRVRDPIKMAVIGAGAMGQHHLRVCHASKSVELVAVVDIDESRAQQSAERYGCRAYTRFEDLVGKVEAAIIAVPSVLHASVGEFCLSNGIHCLIEKPLATTEADCQNLLRVAREKSRILLVGHVERFNPGIQKLIEIVSDGCIIHAIDAKRFSFNLHRATDVDVILDVMLHDLDIVLSFVKEPLLECSIQTLCPIEASQPEYAVAALKFSGHTIANITASRMTQKKLRMLEMTTDVGYLSFNYLTQELFVYNQVDRMPRESSMCQVREQIPVRPGDALTSENHNFVESIYAGIPLGVTGEVALASLRLVWQLQQQMSLPMPGKIV